MLPGLFQFLNPAWGWGLLAAAGVPLLAHLLSQRGGKLAGFPAVRFIQQATADAARWLRPRHWLLLLLRMLLLALIALAFARPVYYRTAPVADPSQGIITAFVLDRSASMTRVQDGVTLFETAKRRVIDALESLDPARDLATVVLVERHPHTLLPEATAGFSHLIGLVEALEPTQEAGDLDAALRLALTETSYATQASRGEAHGEAATVRPAFVEVFSDMQESQWADVLRSPLPLDDATLRLRPVGDASANLALFEPRTNPVRPVAGQPAMVSVDVANFSYEDAQPTVAMRFGDLIERQTLRVPANSTISASFNVMPAAPGPQRVELAFVDHVDSLTLDDRTAATFTVDGARPVALVTDADASDSYTAAYFVARALRPEDPDAEQQRASGVALATWRSEQLLAGLQGGGRPVPNVVVICEAQPLSDEALEALHRYLRDGGGVVWVVDSPAAAESLARLNSLGGQMGLSPIVPEPQVHWRPQANLTIAGGAFDDPILAAFEGPSRGAVINAHFAQVLAGRATPRARTLLTFEDGTPALALQWIGSGRLAVLGASLSPAHTEAGKGPLLLPLLHQLLRHLTPGIPAPPNPEPGSHPLLAIEGTWSEGDVRALDDAGEPLRATISARTGQSTLVQLDAPARVGGVTIVQRDNGTVLAHAQVELSVRESDMNQASDASLAALLKRQPHALPGGQANAAAETDTLRPAPLELWPYLVAGALLLAAVEMIALIVLGGVSVAAEPTGAFNA